MAYYMKTIIKEPYEKEKIETFINEDELIRAKVGGEYKQEPLPGVEDVDVIRLLNNNPERGENLRNPETGEIWRGTVIFVGANAGGEPEPLTDEQREDVFEFIRNNRADLDEEEYEVDETLADEFDINEDYDNTLKDMAEFNKKRDKGQGYFVKYDAGNVPLNNARFNNSVDVNADGGVGGFVASAFGESVDKNKKVCSECNKPIEEGYVIDDGEEYYCSEECLHKHYTPEEYERMERNSQIAFNDEGYDYEVKEGHWETFKNELEEAYDDIRYIVRDEEGNQIGTEPTETDKLRQLADNTEEIDTIKKDIIDVYDPVSAMILHSTITNEWFAFFSKDGDRIIEKREDIMKLLDAETNDTEYQETFDDIMKSGIRLGQTSDGSLYHVDDFGEEGELKNGLPERGTFIVVTDSGDILRVDNIVEFYQSRF
jgi:YHS domain-containing protein